MSIDFVYTVKCQNSSILNNSVKCDYSFNVKNSFISNNSVQHKYTVYLSKTFLFQAILFSQTVLIQLSVSMQLVLFKPQIGPYQVLPFRARVDLGAMAIKGNSTFPKAAALLKPHHQIVQCHILDTRWGSLTPLQRSSRCILQPQQTRQGYLDWTSQSG